MFEKNFSGAELDLETETVYCGHEVVYVIRCIGCHKECDKTDKKQGILKKYFITEDEFIEHCDS